MSQTQAKQILKKTFGYDTFRPLQEEVIENVLQHRDTLVIMPTGGGKSLCYQIPALIFPGLTVVVSPLISLMKDQVEQLTELGIPAVFLNSSLSYEEYRENADRIRRQEIKLLYVAPEALLTTRLLGLLVDSVQVDCLAIDEAHCISEWGHDFRPEYRQLVEVRQEFPSAVCVALTATATPRVRADIQSSLGFRSEDEFIASFNRENLFLEVIPKENPTRQVIEFIRRFPDQSGIIYCFTRKEVDDLTAALAKQGFSVLPYHAGLEDAERKHNQELFIRDDIQIIVATIAFGMGINKPNVRFIVHYDLPRTLENYYQEIGRAGRDGLPAHCLLLFSYGDVQKIKYFIRQKDGDEQRIAQMHMKALLDYADSDVCRRIPLLSHFGESYNGDHCNNCDNCLKTDVERVDLTIPAQKFLSCVKRTGELFGSNHIVDVLLGSENEKVLRFGHQNLSTYGIGEEYSRAQWLRLARLLLQKGYLVQDGQYGSLKLTPRAYEVFRGQETVLGTMQEPRKPQPKETVQEGELQKDDVLFDLLRKKRKELADAAGLPPYIIFSDKTLIDMATYFPDTTQKLQKIFGVGAVKLEKYGDAFLDVIIAYCQEHNLKPRSKQAVPKSQLPLEAQKPRHVQYGEAYQSGQSIEQIAEQFFVQPGTVLDNLYKYANEGNLLKPDQLLELSRLSTQEQEKVFTAFASAGTQYLKPVFEALGGTVSYDELKILRLVYSTRIEPSETS
jgi:ATP-dependent DNA helicase RecQ